MRLKADKNMGGTVTPSDKQKSTHFLIPKSVNVVIWSHLAISSGRQTYGSDWFPESKNRLFVYKRHVLTHSVLRGSRLRSSNLDSIVLKARDKFDSCANVDVAM